MHADLDAFFASVEQLDHPEYRGKAVIVGGLPGDRRSVVSTASYEARAFGVHSAMPIVTAVKLCPGGIYLRGNLARYREKSREVMDVFAGFSPDVQQLSVDEAFLDIGGTEKLFGPPGELAQKLKTAVKEKTGLVVSVGLASNKYLAKIVSGIQKPDGFFMVEEGKEEQFMAAQSVTKIWGAGPKTQDELKKRGFKTCADLQELSQEMLVSLFGNAFGAFLYRAVRGQAAETFDGERGTRSMSAERTFPHDLFDEFEIETQLFNISTELMFRLLHSSYQSKTVTIKIRYGRDFSTTSARETFQTAVTTFNELYDRLLALFRRKYQTGCGLRLLGAGLGNLEEKDTLVQGDLFNEESEKERKLEKSVLAINDKFPHALQRGRFFLGDARR
jgi:DNA polymerase-4